MPFGNFSSHEYIKTFSKAHVWYTGLVNITSLIPLGLHIRDTADVFVYLLQAFQM